MLRISYLCNKSPPHICYLTGYVGSAKGLAGSSSSWILTRLQSRYQPGLQHLKAYPGQDLLPCSFTILLAEFSSRQAIGQRASVPYYLASPEGSQPGVRAGEKEEENASKMKVTGFYNLISEVISHPFC